MANSPQVAFKVLHIDGVEPNQSRKQTYVELAQLRSEDVWSATLHQYLFYPVESLKYGHNILIVCFLICGKPRFVDPGVDVFLHPFADLINLVP